MRCGNAELFSQPVLRAPLALQPSPRAFFDGFHGEQIFAKSEQNVKPYVRFFLSRDESMAYGKLAGSSLMANLLEVFRRRAAKLLDEREGTQAELAAAVGKTPQWASEFLTGKKGVPLLVAAEIARYLGVEFVEMFDKQPPPSNRYELSPDEIDLIRAVRTLDPADRIVLASNVNWLRAKTRGHPSGRRPAVTKNAG